MLRTVGDQATLWESLLPVEALVMPAELVRVDGLLDDDRLLRAVSGVFPALLLHPWVIGGVGGSVCGRRGRALPGR